MSQIGYLTGVNIESIPLKTASRTASIISDKEKLFALLVMFIASCLYGYTLNKISSIILDLEHSNENFKNQSKAME